MRRIRGFPQLGVKRAHLFLGHVSYRTRLGNREMADQLPPWIKSRERAFVRKDTHRTSRTAKWLIQPASCPTPRQDRKGMTALR
jgi:hypothetical protein